MFKKIITFISLIAVIATAICCPVAAAEVEEASFGFYYSADMATVYGKDITTEGELQIPASVNGITVKKIESDGFDDYEKIDSVFIPDSIETIGSNAFADCLTLTKIDLGSKVQHIEKDAFINTGYYNDINNWDETGALYIQDALIKVDPLCEGEFVVKEGTRVIADAAFENCTKIKQVLLPESVESIGADAFAGSGVLENSDNWVSDCLYIGNWLIAAKDTVAPEIKVGTKYIADGAFRYNKTLQSVTIPEGVLKIGAYAFWDCRELTDLKIPSTVKYIGTDAFVFCNIKTISLDSNNKDFALQNGILYTHDLKCLVFCPQQMTGEIKLPEETEHIGEAAFWRCEGIEKMVFSKSLKSIGRSAFSECYKLNDINLPDSLKHIGRFAFSNCLGITKMVIPYSVVELEENAFSYCINMESIDIGSGIKEIKAWTFEYCEKLNSVTLPYGIEKIGYLAFYQTALLENEENYDSQGLLYIGKYLIKAKENETGIYDVPDGIELIAMDCFEDCYDVQNIILPGSLKYINDCALSVRNKNQKITFHGTEEQWYDIITDSCIGTYPEEGIRMLSDFPTTLLICVISVTVISTTLLVLIYKKQKGVVPICSEESGEDK